MTRNESIKTVLTAGLLAVLVPVMTPGAALAAPGLGVMDLPIERPIHGSATPPSAPAPAPAPKVTPTATPTPTPAPKPANEPTEPGWEDPDDVPQEDPPTFFGEEIVTPGDSIIFVIDRSGSMWLGVGPFVGLDGQVVENGNRLDRAKMELKRSISALTDSFTFNVIFYDECIYQWLGTRVEASDANKAKSFSFIDSITPNGWTNVGMAAYAALQDKDNTTVVLLSDGAPNFLDCALEYVGDEGVHREIIRMGNTQGATINTFGIGLDDQARQFMMNVAAENGGRFSEIS